MAKEPEQRTSYARSLLERGVRVSSVATMLSARYAVARSTAYLDIQAAELQIQDSDDGPDSEEASQPLCPDSILAQLQHRFDIAAATGDAKEMSMLTKSIDTVKRWNGYNTESANPFV